MTIATTPKADAQLLRETFEIAVADERFGMRFYDRLFASHPELKKLFTRNSSGAQQKMFAQKLAAIVDTIVEPKVLAEEARSIARTHGSYGVTPEMYDIVGDVLMATLRESVGASFTPEAERAWKSAYATITKMILAP